jgi:uncharacterized membrane protein YfcA
VSLPEVLLLTACAAAAGAVNALAGGGMLVAYPVLVALGLSPIAANATATVALLSGGIGAQIGYRSEMKGTGAYARALVMPCIVGGMFGAFLLLRTPPRQFAAMVPGLVLFATMLFAAQTSITRFALHLHSMLGWPRIAPAAPDGTLRGPGTALLMTQFAISIYIGYFGAGAGALMLANLGFMGLANIHQMNGLKLWCGMLTNVTAAFIFALQPSLVQWPLVIVMTAGSIAGGYASSRVAQRVSQRSVRIMIVLIGVGMAVWLAASAIESRQSH